MNKKKQRKQRSMMYTQQMRLAKLPDWKEEIARIVKQTNPLHWAGILHDKDLDEHGDIVEQGTHEELMKKQGFYEKLYNAQFAQQE